MEREACQCNLCRHTNIKINHRVFLPSAGAAKSLTTSWIIHYEKLTTQFGDAHVTLKVHSLSISGVFRLSVCNVAEIFGNFRLVRSRVLSTVVQKFSLFSHSLNYDCP